MKFLFSLCLTLNLISTKIQGQKLEYDIFIKDKKIGSLVAELFNMDDTSRFVIKTEAEVNLIFTFELSHIIRSTFVNKMFYYSFTKNIMNEKEKERTETKAFKYFNEFYSDNEIKYRITEPISYSVAQLYHTIPKNITKVYSERFGKFLKLQKVEDYVFELTLPDGKKNLYYYGKDEICQKVVTEQTFTDLIILLKQ